MVLSKRDVSDVQEAEREREVGRWRFNLSVITYKPYESHLSSSVVIPLPEILIPTYPSLEGRCYTPVCRTHLQNSSFIPHDFLSLSLRICSQNKPHALGRVSMVRGEICNSEH